MQASPAYVRDIVSGGLLTQAIPRQTSHPICNPPDFKPQLNNVAFWPSMAKAAVQAEYALFRCRVPVMMMHPCL